MHERLAICQQMSPCPDSELAVKCEGVERIIHPVNTSRTLVQITWINLTIVPQISEDDKCWLVDH